MDAQVIDLEQRISKICDQRRLLEESKENILQSFFLLREELSLVIDPVQK